MIIPKTCVLTCKTSIWQKLCFMNDLNEWKVVTPYWELIPRTWQEEDDVQSPASPLLRCQWAHDYLVTTHLRLHWPGLAAESEWVSITECQYCACVNTSQTRTITQTQSVRQTCGWVLLVLFIFTLRWFSLVTKSRKVFDEFQNVNNIKLCLTK